MRTQHASQTHSPHERTRATSGLALAQTVADAPSLNEARDTMLGWLRTQLAYDAAILHALSPRVPLTTAAVVGVDLSALARSQSQWDDLAVELGALREAANASGAASLDQVFTPRSRHGRRVRDLLWSLFRMRSMCIVHLVVRQRLRAAVVLFRARARAFTSDELAMLREVAPLLAVCDGLHEELDNAPRVTTPVHFRCRDQRLTPRQRELVEHVALGHTNQEIGAALNLSPNTVRNILARVFARVGASNRADLIRVCVLGPELTRSVPRVAESRRPRRMPKKRST